jgi:predicted transcriptional regulator
VTPDLHQLADLRSAAAAHRLARWILPVAPIYRARIASGEKTVELRTYRTGIGPGDWVLLYESSPISGITMAVLIGVVEKWCPRRLWEAPGPLRLGVSPEAWQRAFASVPVVWLHRIEQVVELAPIDRAALADRWPGWRAPQRAQRRSPAAWPSPAAWLEPQPLERPPTRPVQLLLPIDFSTPADHIR